MKSKRLNTLIILDGYAFSDNIKQSAIHGNSPYIDSLIDTYPNTRIGASGIDVGLPDGQMGNSEVGHLNIGAGRVVYQELTRITKAISDGDFFSNEALENIIAYVNKNNKDLHLYGLLSDGGVHSHIEHLFAAIKMAKLNNVRQVYIHCFMDGRDVSPTSGADYIKQLYEYTTSLGYGQISTIVGRYYAMDRDNRWERVEVAYKALSDGEGEEVVCPYEAVKKSYSDGVTDEFIKPIIVKGSKRIKKGDGVIFFNFRPDRAREITRCFVDKDFDGFKRKSFLDVKYVCMTQYDAKMPNVEIAFKPQSLTNTFGEYISNLGYSQVRLAETEKYAHVTFFFNGGVEKENRGETRILVPSPKVATYDLKPDMSAVEVADKALDVIREGKTDVMIINFANCDMVGHTGIMIAAQSAVKTVDEQVKRIVDAILKVGGSCIITADHGNADKMIDDDGSVFTAHTTNAVPFILVDDTRKHEKLRKGGRLCDITPTMLRMMEEDIPLEMTGQSLI